MDRGRTNNLDLNILKTKEVIVDSRRKHKDPLPLVINNTEVQRADSHKFLGVNISSTLKWKDNTDSVLKKSHQRLFFLKQLKKCGVSRRGLLHFYGGAVESILSFAIIV